MQGLPETGHHRQGGEEQADVPRLLSCWGDHLPGGCNGLQDQLMCDLELVELLVVVCVIF